MTVLFLPLGLVTGYLEIESVSGATLLIPSFGIQLICEHGVQPEVTVIRHHRATERES